MTEKTVCVFSVLPTIFFESSLVYLRFFLIIGSILYFNSLFEKFSADYDLVNFKFTVTENENVGTLACIK